MIKVEGVYKQFGKKQVLDNVELEIYDGETLTIIGGSGCGKTVLLKHLVGLLKPDKGEIYVDDQQISKLEDEQLWKIQQKFGYLFQGAALFDSLTVAENVAFGLRNMKLPYTEVMRRVKEGLRHVGLKDIENQKPAELSGGMRKRVGLARAIAYAPKYVCYDEPTTGLDPITSDTINELILKLQGELKVTSIVVTHDLKSAYKISNRIAMLHQGKIVEIGTPEEIQHTKNPFVRQFIEGSCNGPIQVLY
ncbi:MAG: ABC transporter ATP-binding protein [Elusimicrobiota bacterium]